MAQEKMTSKIFVGVVATVLSAIILAAIGLGGGGSGGGSSGGGSEDFSPSQTPEAPAVSDMCVTNGGTCQVQPLPEGSYCECFDGYLWWPGNT